MPHRLKLRNLCHPERSEGSLNYNKAILRCAQDDIFLSSVRAPNDPASKLQMNNQSYSLTKTQKRVWFNSKISEKTLPNIAMVFELAGDLDIWALRKAIEDLVLEHSVLKSTIYSSAEHLERIVSPTVRGNLEFVDLTQSEQKVDIFWLLQNIVTVRFNLGTGPLFHFHLIKESNEQFYFTILIHPIIVDRYSLKYLIEEISRHYNCIINNSDTGDREELFDFDKIVELEKNFYASEKCRQGLTHWTNTLKSNQFNLELPRKGYFPSQDYADSPFFEFYLNANLRQTILDFAKTCQVDYSIVLLAAYQALLHKYTGNHDVIINYSSAVTYTEKKVFGCLENRLPLRVLLSDEMNFTDLVKLTQTQLSYDSYYKDIQINDIVKSIRDKYDSHFSGIFTNTSFDANYLPYEQLCLGSVKARLIPKFMKKFVPESLALYYRDTGKTISFIADFDENIDNTAVKNLLQHYEALLAGCLRAPNKAIAKQCMLTQNEYQKIVLDWNNTDEAYTHEFIHRLFEQQARHTPDAIAIVYENSQLTYRELNEKTNQLARLISLQFDALKTQPKDKLVGICLKRSMEMIISMLAILKAGAGYVPLEPSYPEERMCFILDDTAINILVTDEATLKQWPLLAENERHVLCLDKEAENIARQSTENLTVPVQFSNLAYVIYTSGSTGQPKGVMIEHRSVPNYIYGFAKYFQLAPKKRLLQFSSMNFDAIISDVFATLAYGATLYVVSTELRQSADKLIDYIENNAITTALLPPALLRILPRRHLPQFDSLAFGGDVCDQDTVDYWAKGRRFLNCYGPTECTTSSTIGLLQPGDLNNRLGRPLPNYRAYVLDKHMNPMPIGMIGELYIGGLGLARGYLNRPELTKERFVPNSFGPGQLYKTGDLVRFMPDSNIEYIGRADFEVKIRGFRIQLSDIEHVLQMLPEVKQVTLKLWEKAGLDKAIAAYYVLKDYASLTKEQLREHLKKHLPDYMVPAYLVELEAIPVLVNGKINKAELPDPFPRSTRGTINNEEEQSLKEIWAELFKISTDAITANSDFFDLGGHSLLATQLASRIKARMRVEITIKSIFQHSQLKQLAKMIRDTQSMQAVKFQLQKAPEQTLYFPSSSQLRLWYFFKTLQNTATYNILFTVVFSQNVDVIVLRKSITKLITTHENFRTTFVEHLGEAYLKIHDKVQCEIPLLDCQSQSEIQAEIDKEKEYSFDLNNLPLFRCKLLLSEANGVTLLLNIHHIIFDGGSLDVFMRELGEIYTGILQNKPVELKKNAIEFKDFAHSQLAWEKSGLFDQQLAYWQRKLFMPLPILELPTDYKRGRVMSYHGDALRFNLPKNLVLLAKKIAASHKCSLFSLLLSVYYVLLFRITHQRDVIVASPIANRTQQELEQLIGLLANVITYRAKFSEEMQFDALLQAVNEDVLNSQENQDLPFSTIVNQIQAGRDTSRNPVFQTMFVLQSGFKLSNKLWNTDVSYHITEEHTKTAKFDLTLVLYDNSSEDAISGYFEFNTTLFRRETIARYLNYFTHILRSVTENPQRCIENIALLPAEEYIMTVHEWNQTAVAIPSITIQSAFEQQVEVLPDHIAAVYKDETISYYALNKKANQLANYLRKQFYFFEQRELSADTLIGLCVDRGIDMLIGILAILKAGAAYLPLDPHYPRERLIYMLTDSATKIILTNKNQVHQLDFLCQQNVICLDTDLAEIEREDSTNLTINTKPTDLAYIIYTSGSTGQPKGVMIEHKGVINLAEDSRARFNITAQNKNLQFASANFDAAVFEIFITLLNGATLYITEEELRISPDKLVDYLAANQINYALLPPALLRVLPKKELTELHTLGFGGDTCDQETMDYWAKGRCFFNAYGPTEITVCATQSMLNSGDIVNRIGKPLNNYKIYVLDQNLSPVPIGVVGELYVGGIGLARGYLNRADLSVERFIVNPFSDNPSERIYKTGDLVRWLMEGELEYIGRSDFQVQIRGFRVEVGEIEEQLSRHSAIKEVTVVAIGDDIAKQLIAYYTQHDPEQELNELRKYLQTTLPDYMIPTAFIHLDSMPLSPSGKIDKKALPKLQEVTQNHYIAPRNSLESALVEIWSELFNYQKIGVRDDFFSLGGNSLLSIRMLARVKTQFEKEISLTQFFQHPTIESMAEMLSGNLESIALDMVSIAEQDASQHLVYEKMIYPEQTETKHVLLTGANGFLGVHLLQELLDQTTAVIHCVVRGKNAEELYEKMQTTLTQFGMATSLENPRIRLVRGDLTQPHIGMDPSLWDFMLENCDAIYHNGSLVNHIYHYQMLKPANVNSTIELIKLATNGKSKRFHYISTLSAGSQFNAEGSLLETGPGNKPAATSGYQLSKWVSEKLLLRALENGLKVTIFRPGNITGNLQTGATHFLNNNALLFLKSCLQLGVAPLWETHIDMTPVDMLSQAIVKLSLQANLTQNIFNLANPNLLSWKTYFTLVQQHGFNLQLVSPEEWMERLKNITEENALYPLRELYLENPELGKIGPRYQFENTASQKLLEKLGVSYPKHVSDMVGLYLHYLDKQGFLT